MKVKFELPFKNRRGKYITRSFKGTDLNQCMERFERWAEREEVDLEIYSYKVVEE